jgi:8-oxo-dGTP pyrophosphatase MutT (NUDIX family)
MITGRTMPHSIVDLAGCVIMDGLGGVLLLHRYRAGRVQWETPGGKVRCGESARNAAQRETLEEIGVRVKVGVCVGRTEFTEGATHYQYHCFLAEIPSDEVPRVAEPWNHDDLQRFTATQLRQMKNALSPNLLKILDASLLEQIEIKQGCRDLP